jgi:hypothetical protein
MEWCVMSCCRASSRFAPPIPIPSDPRRWAAGGSRVEPAFALQAQNFAQAGGLAARHFHPVSAP